MGDTVRSYRKKKVGEKERHGNFEEGTKKVTAITKSMGQKFYKLDNESREYIRADVHLIKKGPRALPDDLRHLEPFDGEAVAADVNDRRNIDLDEADRSQDPPAQAKEADKDLEEIKERIRLKKMNKTARAKHLAKKQPGPGPDLSGALGGRAAGSGMFGRPI